jgi:hypothetical protein
MRSEHAADGCSEDAKSLRESAAGGGEHGSAERFARCAPPLLSGSARHLH